jgi:hypothetical protein
MPALKMRVTELFEKLTTWYWNTETIGGEVIEELRTYRFTETSLRFQTSRL